MAYFLIDLENTHSSGFWGAQYLDPGDTVALFCSESCRQLERAY